MRSRRAAKIDANQPAIVKALRQVGAGVVSLAGLGEGIPDLLIGHKQTKRLGLIEVKDGTKPPSKRKKTDEQIKFWEEWEGYPMAMVTDINGALRFYKMLGTYSEINRMNPGAFDLLPPNESACGPATLSPDHSEQVGAGT